MYDLLPGYPGWGVCQQRVPLYSHLPRGVPQPMATNLISRSVWLYHQNAPLFSFLFRPQENRIVSTKYLHTSKYPESIMGSTLPQGAQRTWIYRTPIQRLTGPVGPLVPAQSNPDSYHPQSRQHIYAIQPIQQTVSSVKSGIESYNPRVRNRARTD